MLKLALMSLTEGKEHSPVNLAYLATYLKKNLKEKVSVKIIDTNFDNIAGKLSEYNPDIVGISGMTLHYETAKRIAFFIKKYLKIPILIGGVHISTCPESLTKNFDIAVIGEGEQILLDLVKLYLKEGMFNKKKLIKINNLAFFQGDKLVQTPRKELKKNIDEFPIPDRNFLNPNYFKPRKFEDLQPNKKFIRTELVTARGCPYKCIFCSSSHFWERVRFHSPERVVGEIDYLNKKFGVDNLHITDDLFAFDKKRLLKIKELMKEKKLLGKISLFCQIRGNLADEELLDILKSMNVISVNIGLESGDDKVLRTLKGENITVSQVTNAVRLSKERGFEVHGSLMMASPGETKKEMKKTLSYMNSLKKIGINECWCGVTTPLPKTRLWDIAKISKNIDWDILDPSIPFNPYFLDPSIKLKDFLKLFKKSKKISFEISEENGGHRKSKLKGFLRNSFLFNKNLYYFLFNLRKARKYKKLKKDFKNYFE